MNIRPIVLNDREHVSTLLRDAGNFRADETHVALELIDDVLASSDHYRILVAELDQFAPAILPRGLAGYICYGQTPMTAATYDLYWIVTHQAVRRQGVASALIRQMEVDLRQHGATAVRVETSEQPSYTAARQLYHRLEYPQAAHLEDFYGPGDGLILYYKRL